jgi:hypothetical protein
VLYTSFFPIILDTVTDLCQDVQHGMQHDTYNDYTGAVAG